MNFLTSAIAGLAVIGALASPAFAQGEGGRALAELPDSTFVLVTPGGKMMERKITDPAMAKMMMKDATPMTAGTMMMMHGGKMYMVPDQKMSDGRMLSEMMMR